jgi:hypothetical protein
MIGLALRSVSSSHLGDSVEIPQRQAVRQNQVARLRERCSPGDGVELETAARLPRPG